MRPRRLEIGINKMTMLCPSAGSRARAGQTVTEFALVAPIFFLVIFGLMDLGRVYCAQVNLQSAAQEAGRFASTGNHLNDPNHPGTNLSRVDSIIQTAKAAVFGGYISSVQVSSLNGGAGSAGGPQDTVTVLITSKLPLMTPMVGRFFPSGVCILTSTATFKNEPFPPGNTK
jgi:Flp pilus assembly protein TadG